MKNKFMQTTAGTFLALLVLLGTSQIFVCGQEKVNGEGFGIFGNSKPTIEGVWQTTVTQRNCQTGEAIRSFRGLSTFHEGGTVSETAAGSSPTLRSPGHGVWEKESRTSFSGSFIFLRFNADGTFAGTQKTTQTFVISGRNGSIFDSTGTVQVFDANDNLLGSGCATAVGTRFE